MDAFELLKADHQRVAELFDQLEKVSGKQKLDVFKRINSELELHAHIEETILYPAIEKPEKTHDLTLEAYEEHKVVKTLLAELSGAKSATDEWQAKAKVLRENVEHHVEEEENELFDKTKEVLSDKEIASIGERMTAEKAKKQGRPAPKRAATKESSKTAADKPGILSTLANLVGLGGGANKRAVKKSASKKSATKNAPTKSAAKKKTTAGKGSKKSATSTKASTRKRPSTKSASKRTISKKEPAATAGKKTSKKAPVANRRRAHLRIV